MRKILTIGVMMLCVSIHIPLFTASAVEACVKLTTSTTCTSTLTPGQADWDAVCEGVTVRGIGICSSTQGDRLSLATMVETSNEIDSNTNCWCMMTSPAMSYMVAVGTLSSTAGCSYSCANRCATEIKNDGFFRRAMFSNLYDVQN